MLTRIRIFTPTPNIDGAVRFTDTKPVGSEHEVLQFKDYVAKQDPIVAQRRAEMAAVADRIRQDRKKASQRKKRRKQAPSRSSEQVVEYHYNPALARTLRQSRIRTQAVSQEIQPPLPRSRLPKVKLISR